MTVMIVPEAPKTLQLGQVLLDQGVVTAEQIEAALEEQRGSGHRLLLGEVLVRMGFCDEEQILRSLARGYQVPFARLSAKTADPNVIAELPREFEDKHLVLPLFKVRDMLTLAVNEPSNVFLVEEVARMTGCNVQIVCATAEDIRAALAGQKPQADIFVLDEIIDNAEDAEFDLVERMVEDVSNVDVGSGDSPVIKLVNYLICSASREGASDIHIEPDEGTVRVRFRVDGRLYEKMRPPAKLLPAIVSRVKIMAKLDISERRLPQDGGIHVLMDGRPIDLRVSTMSGSHGEKVVIRVIDNRGAMVNLEQLGFAHETLMAFRGLIRVPTGIVLVTGPTGSGKSTTLYSALAEIDDEEMNVSTVEDPIEYNLKGVNQFQVSGKVGFTFARALRSLLRQDPDVIMVGEIRDEETARVAVQSALTGHLVFSTLHTNDAPGAIARLLDIGIEPYLVAASIQAVLGQRLVRKICNSCKEPYDPHPDIRAAAEKVVGEIETFFHGRGCSRCRKSGFSGRIGIHELLTPTDALRQGVNATPDVAALRHVALADGMVSLRADGLAKVKKGITTVEEIFRATTG